MGTYITLSLNGIDIDWGKNEYWTRHHWLFPPGSLGITEYRYAGDVVELKPGFQTTLGEARFRLSHLGFSEQETRDKFDAALSRWNRTANLGLTFADFHGALTRLNFGSLTSADLEPFIWDFNKFMVDLLARWDADDARLDDFLLTLDTAVTLRVLSDRPENLRLPLRWAHQDLIDSGWVTLDDLTDIDRPTLTLQHNVLFGRIHDASEQSSIQDFDKWLANRGLPRTAHYLEQRRDGKLVSKTLVLPTAVRNMLHHPENGHNQLLDQDLLESVEQLLTVARDLPGLVSGPA